MAELNDVFDKVVAIVAEETGVSAKELSLVTRLDSVVTDSLELTELILVIREAMGPLPESAPMDTISDVVCWYYARMP